MNLITVRFRRYDYDDLEPKPGKTGKDQYSFESERVKAIQEYGGSVILAASVVAAFTSTHGNLHLEFLLASITLGIVALVPIWVSGTDFRQLAVVRHVKTVVLTVAAALLAEAIMILLMTPLNAR